MQRKRALIAGLIVASAAAAAAPAAASAKVNTLTLKMTGKTIAVVGKAPTSGAVTVISKVSAQSGASPTLAKLQPGGTFAKAVNAANKHNGDTNYSRPYATILFSTEAAPGTSSAQTVLTPGHWVAVDTQGSKPARWPHVSFTVTKAAHPGKLAKPRAIVRAVEFGFAGPATLTDGTMVRFTNSGFLDHMITAIHAPSKAAADSIVQLLKLGKDDQAQAHATGFQTPLADVSSGGLVQEKINWTPGYYVLACFMRTQDGREHTRLGMVREIAVAAPVGTHPG